ncbi:Cell division integral membrane protein, YggT and half-length relatives [hydrothermal vent metagenome]|uniref:Cell division integral membrane protein, YggT and half-length relatives n=1 Tax=hydrothermal vent metagenome TaxID=652676 RepID=A0A3B1B2A8_9ZZZZ
MGGSYAGNAGTFLIQTLFGLYAGAVMLRFLLAVVRADFYNPVSQFLVKVTNPPLLPLRRIIPGIMGIDMASIVLLIALQATQLLLIAAVQGFGIQPLGLLVLTLAGLLSLLFTIYFFTILIQVILSWVSPGNYNPAVALIHSLNEPLLGRARRILPPISGFDLSPILVLIGLQLLEILLVAPIQDLGRGLITG